SISHDLKTPVTAVRGYIEGVLDGVADTADKRRAYLEKAIEKIELLTTMIDDLLLYSKLDSGLMPFSFSRVPALAYIQSVLDDSRPAFEAEGRQLVLSDELKSTAVLRLDAERFRRVVQNILDNAKKHTQPGTGTMTVSLRETTASVVMEFHDNGEGIPAADLPHVFDRFYRADSARTTGGGSGLGLAIARQLVTGMGGRIWAVSRPDEGCSILLSMKKVKLTDGQTEA
ncbi:MAG: sensor histidine kinase, partial [Clostridia bacterium]